MNNTPDQREKRILEISDRLLEKIEKSINEIDRCVVKTKQRTKNVEYDSDLKKPLSECVEETESIEIIDGMIDKMGLKQLVSTLKDIKDIHTSFCDGPAQGDQEDESGIIVLGDIDQSTLEPEADDFEQDGDEPL